MDIIRFLNSFFIGEITEIEKNKRYSTDKRFEVVNFDAERCNFINSNIESYILKSCSGKYTIVYLLIEISDMCIFSLKYDSSENIFKKNICSGDYQFNGKKTYNIYKWIDSYEKLLEAHGISLNKTIEYFYNYLLNDKKIRLKLLLNNPKKTILKK